VELAEIISHPEKLAQIPRESIPPLMLQIASLQNALAARLLESPQKYAADPTEPDTLLSAEQVAPLLSVTPHWLYRHWKQLPFARRLSRRTLRFSEVGLRKWQSAVKRS
jgi:predicted DNA-binding transcriptional regulator AlpA